MTSKPRRATSRHGNLKAARPKAASRPLATAGPAAARLPAGWWAAGKGWPFERFFCPLPFFVADFCFLVFWALLRAIVFRFLGFDNAMFVSVWAELRPMFRDIFFGGVAHDPSQRNLLLFRDLLKGAVKVT